MDDFTIERYDSESAWLAARANSIGGSEIGAVMGVAGYGLSAYTLWARKVGRVPSTLEVTAELKRGKRMETFIAEDYAELTGRKLTDMGRYTLLRSRELPYLTVTLDRVIEGDARGPAPLEIKSHAHVRGWEWKREPPPGELLQVALAQIVTGWSWGSLTADCGDLWPEYVDVERHEELERMIRAAARVFWDCVECQQPPRPDGSPSTVETLNLLYQRHNGKTVELAGDADDWADRLKFGRAEAKKAEAIAEEAKNLLRDAMGDAERAVLPSGRIVRQQISDVPAHARKASTRRTLIIEVE